MEGLTNRTCSKWHPVLQTGAARLDVGRVWLFSPGQFVPRKKHISPSTYSCGFLLTYMCLSELRNKALKSSMEKVGMQEDHGHAGGFKADVAL